jgi:1-acyl-sn-glycerol-3-phosphate acyltransferase
MGSGLVSFVNTVDWLAMCTPVVIEAALGRLDKDVNDARLAAWAPRVLERARVHLTVVGRDKVDASRPSVLMSNHASFYDIPVLYATFGGNLRMVAKKELFKIPIVGRAMHGAGMIEVDRGDRRQAIDSLDRGTRVLIESGSSVWIAPEGTRTTTGKLGKFKKGGFRLAVDAGLPIIPISLRGTGEILPPHSVRTNVGVDVNVTFHPLIETTPYAEAKDKKAALDELVERVRKQIEQAL